MSLFYEILKLHLLVYELVEPDREQGLVGEETTKTTRVFRMVV